MPGCTWGGKNPPPFAPPLQPSTGGNEEEQKDSLEELFGDGPENIGYRGNEDVPASGEQIALPKGLLPKFELKVVKPGDIAGLIGKKRMGPKMLSPVLNFGAEYGVWVIFMAIFLASVGALVNLFFRHTRCDSSCQMAPRSVA